MLDGTHELTRDFTFGMSPGDVSMPPSTGKSKIFIVFYFDDEYDEERSRELGRPFHRTVEKYKKIIPGDRKSVPEGYVSDREREEFPEEYLRFKKQEEAAEDGWRIEHWAMLTSGQVASLKHMNIFTVEQIAELADVNLSNIGTGARQLREHAIAFLETAKTGVAPAKLVNEVEELSGENKLLKNKLEMLTVEMEKLAKAQAVNLPNPVAEVREEIAAAKATAIEIPENYKSMGYPKLKKLCETISTAPVMDKAGAVEIIEEYLS